MCPNRCLALGRSSLHSGLDPVSPAPHTSPATLLHLLSSWQRWLQLTSRCTFLTHYVASALFFCPGTYFHPLIPVSLRGPILMASWWKLFSAPQAESIILSLLSKHSTFPSSGVSIILWFECQLTINTPQDSTLLDGGDCIWFHFVILCLCSQCLG